MRATITSTNAVELSVDRVAPASVEVEGNTLGPPWALAGEGRALSERAEQNELSVEATVVHIRTVSKHIAT